MPIPLGILAAAGVRPAAGGSYELIETITVSGSSTTSVTFSNLNTYSTTYQHLQIRLVARAGRALGNEPLYMSFNGVGGTSYSSHGLTGTAGNTFFTDAVTSASSIERAGNIASANAGTNVFGATVIDILDPYETNKNTTIRSLGGGAYAANTAIGIYSGAFYNTAAISSVTLSNFSATAFVAGSRFSIYGLKASA